jgi:hypothetical protein
MFQINLNLDEKKRKNGKKMKKDVRAISSLHLWEKLIVSQRE